MEKIILDLFGGDNSVDVLIVGAYEALSARSDLFITFVGPYEVLAARLNQHPEFEGRYEIVDCPNILDNNLNPLVAVRTGEPFSLIKGCELLASTDAKSYVSVGSTGSLIVSSMRNGVKYKTAQVSIKTYSEILREHLSMGKDVIYIACSSALSSSVKTAYVVRDELRTEFPDRKVIIIDSLISGMAQGLLAIECAKMRDQGKSIDEVETWIEDHKLF